MPQLQGLARPVTYFREPEDVNVVLSHTGQTSAPNGLTLTTSPILWNPVPGEEILVVTGRARKDLFIVAFYRLPKDRYRIASSFVLKDDKGPIAIGYNPMGRRRLTWGTCWDCRAESGNITYREDGRVVITQK